MDIKNLEIVRKLVRNTEDLSGMAGDIAKVHPDHNMVESHISVFQGVDHNSSFVATPELNREEVGQVYDIIFKSIDRQLGSNVDKLRKLGVDGIDDIA